MADHTKHDAPETNLAKAVKEEQSKAQDKAHELGHEAKKTTHETKETAKDKINRAKKGEMTEEEKKKFLATAGAVVAFVAAVALGGYKIHQHRKEKREEEEFAGTIHAKTKRFGHWFGHKAGEAKDATADGLSKATSKVPHPHLPHKTEKSMMKASEKSDSIVRSTYDKAADTAEAVKDKAKGAAHATSDKAKGAAHYAQDKAKSITHSGKDVSKHVSEAKEHAKETVHEEKQGFLGGIKGWLGDRKAELDEAARIGRKEQAYVADKAHYKVDQLVHKVKH